MSGPPLETPASLFGRLRLGREEFCQRLLTSLILEGPYPKWNTRSRASVSGIAFLRDLHALSFGTDWLGDDFWFVDEFELPARSAEEKGAYPDYTLLWNDRIWIIELKTEAGSHRPTQIPYYFELGRHHHPDVPIDFTYLTGPGSKTGQSTNAWERFAHLEWRTIRDLLRRHWPERHTEVVDGLVATIDGLDEAAASWRSEAARLYGTPPPAPEETEPMGEALRLAKATADDGEQRALDVRFNSLETLHELRMQLREQLVATAQGDPRRRVLPWAWRWQSGGRPLTASGEATGYELRLSRYENACYGWERDRRTDPAAVTAPLVLRGRRPSPFETAAHVAESSECTSQHSGHSAPTGCGGAR